MLRFHRGAVKSVKCALMLGASDSSANPQRSDHQVLLPLCTPHTHKHTLTRPHTPYTHSHMHAYTCAHAHSTHTHTYMHTAHTHTPHTLTLMHTHMHTLHTHVHTHTCTHHTHMHTQTHAHTHMHTQTHALPHIRLAVRQALQADLVSLQLPHSAPLITSLRNGLFICKTRFIMPSLQG